MVENRKEDVRETAASVPAEMEGAVVKMDGGGTISVAYIEGFTDSICPYHTMFPPAILGGPGDALTASSSGLGAQPDSPDSGVSVNSSVDDLVEAYDRNN